MTDQFLWYQVKWTATARIGINTTKAWLSQVVNLKNAIWTSKERYAIKFCFKRKKCRAMKAGSTAMTKRPRDRVPRGSMLALPDPRWSDKGNSPTKIWWSLFFLQQWHHLHALGYNWTDSQRGILCWGFKGVQEEIPSEEASTFKSAQWHFHQDNAPVYNSILVTDYMTKMGIKTVSHPP